MKEIKRGLHVENDKREARQTNLKSTHTGDDKTPLEVKTGDFIVAKVDVDCRRKDSCYLLGK